MDLVLKAAWYIRRYLDRVVNSRKGGKNLTRISEAFSLRSCVSGTHRFNILDVTSQAQK